MPPLLGTGQRNIIVLVGGVWLRLPWTITSPNTVRISIRQLYLQGQIRPGLITNGILPGCGLPFRAGLDRDLERGFIQIREQFWDIRTKPTRLLHCYDDSHFFVLGTDGKPYRELLVTGDGRVGVRGDLGCHYASSHQNLLTRRFKRRHAIFCQLLITDQDPADMSRAYVPRDGCRGLVDGIEPKVKGKWWSTFWERWKKHQPRPGIPITPVRRPSGIRTRVFYDLLNRLNRHHIRSGRVRALEVDDRSGEREIAAINSIFRRHKR